MRWLSAMVIAASCVACSGGEVERLEQNNDALEEQVELLKAALEEANNQIEQTASDISSAKLFAFGGDCDNLETAVQMLDEPETVSEP